MVEDAAVALDLHRQHVAKGAQGPRYRRRRLHLPQPPELVALAPSAAPAANACASAPCFRQQFGMRRRQSKCLLAPRLPLHSQTPSPSPRRSPHEGMVAVGCLVVGAGMFLQGLLHEGEGEARSASVPTWAPSKQSCGCHVARILHEALARPRVVRRVAVEMRHVVVPALSQEWTCAVTANWARQHMPRCG